MLTLYNIHTYTFNIYQTNMDKYIDSYCLLKNINNN